MENKGMARNGGFEGVGELLIVRPYLATKFYFLKALSGDMVVLCHGYLLTNCEGYFCEILV